MTGRKPWPVALPALLCSSCLIIDATQIREERATSKAYVNSSAGLERGQGRIFADNPIIVTENYRLDENYDMNQVLLRDETIVAISESQFLEMHCRITTSNGISYYADDCYKNYNDKLRRPLTNPDRLWAYDANTPEFLQVNTFGHTKLLIEKWMENLRFLYENMAYNVDSFYPRRAYDTSIPSGIFQNGGFWFPRPQESLVSYSGCQEPDGAYYSPAENKICLAYDKATQKVDFSQDPTIVYHEVGHALQKVMLNIRNFSAGNDTSVDLGSLFYEEAGGIGEGVSDYFSYYMNHRTHFAEWGLGRFLNVSRPLEEDDSLHAPGISSDRSERLSYPEYLTYEPNKTEEVVEDVHNAGMIISHYLHALTEDLKEYCSWETDASVRYVMAVMTETYAEMGDLGARGSDFNSIGFANLDPDNAWDWFHKVNPINYRRFSQTMARKIYTTLGDGQALSRRTDTPWDCAGNSYPKDRIETVLDMYGLLLFDTYNTDGNGIADGHNGIHTNTVPNPVINPVNRIKSVTIKKKYLIQNPEPEAPKAYVIDKRSNMIEALQALTASGRITEISDKIDSHLAYNNGNGKISPGEFVGIVLNLYNNSNSIMGGVQILANDWDHVKNQERIIDGESISRGFPCNNLGDGFPSSLDQGAADLGAGEGVQGGCDYTTRYNGQNPTAEPDEELAPFCLVKGNTEFSTMWIQQDAFIQEIEGFDPEEQCLGETAKDCLVRAAKGGDYAWFAQIHPKSSWSKNLFNKDTGEIDFKSSHLIYLEVNPDIPPGTTFMCRFRGRFTNCDDCFHDERHPPDTSLELFDDFQDYEYSGAKPFQILNFQFTVIN